MHRSRVCVPLAIAALMFVATTATMTGCGGGGGGSSPTASPSPSPTPTPSGLPSPSPLPTASPTPTPTPSPSPSPTVVYTSHFDQPVGSEWSDTKTETTPIGARPFLGRFGQEAVTLSLANLPAHSSITLTFKLFIIKSWDGNTVDNGSGLHVGPDIWSLSLDNTSLLRTTFSNWEAGSTTDNEPQSYPSNFGTGASNPARTGASENDTLGFPSFSPPYPGPYQDAVYNLTYTIPHLASTATYTFSGLEMVSVGTANPVVDDESWGLNSVVVSVQ